MLLIRCKNSAEWTHLVTEEPLLYSSQPSSGHRNVTLMAIMSGCLSAVASHISRCAAFRLAGGHQHSRQQLSWWDISLKTISKTSTQLKPSRYALLLLLRHHKESKEITKWLIRQRDRALSFCLLCRILKTSSQISFNLKKKWQFPHLRSPW